MIQVFRPIPFFSIPSMYTMIVVRLVVTAVLSNDNPFVKGLMGR